MKYKGNNKKKQQKNTPTNLSFQKTSSRGQQMKYLWAHYHKWISKYLNSWHYLSAKSYFHHTAKKK